MPVLGGGGVKWDILPRQQLRHPNTLCNPLDYFTMGVSRQSVEYKKPYTHMVVGTLFWKVKTITDHLRTTKNSVHQITLSRA